MSGDKTMFPACYLYDHTIKTMKKIFLPALIFCCLNVSHAQSGAFDPTFGNNGVVKTDMGAAFKYNASARQALLNADGSIYLLLNATSISKRLSNGALDSTYGLNGYTANIPFTEAYAAFQSDGKIVIVGNTSDNSFSVARINQDGSRDSAFGTNGIQSTAFGGPSFARSVVVQNDGKIVVAGYVTDDMNNTFFAVVRYNTNSSVDEAFNGSGKLLEDFPYKMLGDNGVDSVEIHNSYANSVSLQNDGKIVVGGYVFTGTDNDFALVRYNSNGHPDSTFNSDGKQTTDIASRNNDVGYSIAIQTDGKILLAGYTSAGVSNNFAVVRYTVNGSLDNSFNATGKQISNLGSDMQIGNSMAIQNDGKIVIAGYTLNGTYNDFAIARFNTNGTPDDSFNNDGTLTTDFSSSDDYAGSIAIQADNKIVVAGYSYVYSANANGQQIAVSRYNTDGTLDDSFAGNGKLEGENIQGYTRFNSTFVQPNGKIVVAGQTWNGTDYDFAVARYNENGSLDNTFSDDGKQTTDFGPDDEATSIVVQADGKIVVAGTSSHRFAVARYNVDGSPDNSFSDNGVLTSAIGYDDRCQSLALQTDGRIVLAGVAFTDSNYDSAFFALTRLNTDGTTDNSFGNDGTQLTNFDTSLSFGASVAIQKDGKIIVGGRAYIHNQNNFALARYNTNGTLDATFSEDGKQTNVFTGDGYTGLSLAIQNDGKILFAGFAEDFAGTTSSIAVVRYQTNGNVDSTFGTGGYRLTSIGAHYNFARSVAINYDGKIAVAGNNDNAFIVLYKSDGTPDSTFGINGILTSKIGLRNSSLQSIVFSNNKLYAAGSAQFPGTLGVVVRYLVEGGTLAVSLLDFKATAQNKTVLLQWQVASEQDLSGFAIERGADGNNFNSIGFVRSLGNSNLKVNYSIIDRDPLQGVNFYRLKMIDADGTFRYSKIVSVNMSAISTLRLSPNPAKNILFVRSGKNEAATVQITDAVGRTLRTLKVTLKGDAPTPININDLPAGIYNIQLHTKTTRETSRFIKE